MSFRDIITHSKYYRVFEKIYIKHTGDHGKMSSDDVSQRIVELSSLGKHDASNGDSKYYEM